MDKKLAVKAARKALKFFERNDKKNIGLLMVVIDREEGDVHTTTNMPDADAERIAAFCVTKFGEQIKTEGAK